ncbi:MAG: hypothetical protein C0482_09575 [Gordonia sp.]|nr:hypothetical protein [Gordonia sp. (in: high G+C Gram-positive bacteria)]
MRASLLTRPVAKKDDKGDAEMVDLLINVATILIRHLKAELRCDVASALERARSGCRPELDEYWLNAARLIETVITGEAPGTIEEGPTSPNIFANIFAP